MPNTVHYDVVKRGVHAGSGLSKVSKISKVFKTKIGPVVPKHRTEVATYLYV